MKRKRIQITLTPQETQILEERANKYGYSIRWLIKLIVGKEVCNFLEEKEKAEYTKQAKADLSNINFREFMKRRQEDKRNRDPFSFY
jgi:hypothetical protein